MAVQHQHIADDLRRQIASDVYPVGSRLPSETELAALCGVSRGTIRQAITALQLEGLVDSRQGARRIVLRSSPAQSFAELQSFSQWATRNGRTPGGLMLQLQREPATEAEANLLQVDIADPLLHVLRLRTLDGEPIMIERLVYVPWIANAVESLPRDCPSLTEAVQEATDVVYHYGEHTIDVVTAETTEVTLLGVNAGSPLLRHRHVIMTTNGQPFEASDDRYKAGTMEFSFNNNVTERRMAPLRQISEARDPSVRTPDSSGA
jgi:DNA-binding GntR family transcriptional regulator